MLRNLIFPLKVLYFIDMQRVGINYVCSIGFTLTLFLILCGQYSRIDITFENWILRSLLHVDAGFCSYFMGASLCCTRTILQQFFLNFVSVVNTFRVIKSYLGSMSMMVSARL